MMVPDSTIDVRGLHVRYTGADGQRVRALRGVDLAVAAGEFVLVGGPSGGGKSTLARALAGLIPRTLPAAMEGSISVVGLDPRRCPTSGVAARVGLVFQNPAAHLLNGTVEEEVGFGPRNLGLTAAETAARVRGALEMVAAAHLRQRAGRRLSGGEQQRVALAAALAMRPAVLILDEPAANLDGEGVRLLVRALVEMQRRAGTTLVVFEHRLRPLLPHAGRLVWLVEGRVVADGPPAETLARVQPEQPAGAPPPPSAGAPLVTLQGVSAGYDGRPVLSDCSLTLRRGEFAALAGPNGAGKSTLARVVAGQLRPRRGRVRWGVDGGEPRVGFLQQNPLHQLVCDTVEQEVTFGPRNLGRARTGGLDEVLARTGLLALRGRATGALSVGEQQRTALAAALSLGPRLLILDEPTVGQDRAHLVQLMDAVAGLNRAGQTVLLITHDSELIERYASRVWDMKGGQTCERS
jgi:energy-coupling factor transport system ATP-binding protein